MKPVRGTRFKFTSIGAAINAATAKQFNARGWMMPDGSDRKDVYGGFIFQTKADPFSRTTTVVDPPVEVLGPALAASPDLGAGVFTRYRLSFDRGYLYPSPNRGVPPDDAAAELPVGKVAQILPPIPALAFSLGAPPPEVRYTVAQNNAGRPLLPSSKDFFGGDCTLVTGAPFSFTVSDLRADSPVAMWVIYTIRFAGRKQVTFSVSEAWFQQYLPGYTMVNYASFFHLSLPQMRVVALGQRLVFLSTMRQDFSQDVDESLRDWGACAMVVASVAPDSSGMYSAEWATPYQLLGNSDIRLRVEPGPVADSDYIPSSGYAGYPINSIIPDLVVGPSGVVYCAMVVNTARIARSPFTGDQAENRLWGDALGQTCMVMTWQPTGALTTQVLRSDCDASQALFLEASGRAHDADFVAWATAFGVASRAVTADIATLTTWCKIVHNGVEAIALCDNTEANLTVPDTLDTYPYGDYLPVTSGQVGTYGYEYRLSSLGGAGFGVMTAFSLAGAELHTWTTATTGVAGLIAVSGFGQSAVVQPTQGFRPPSPTQIGTRWFGGLMSNGPPVALTLDPIYTRINLQPPYNVETRRIPRDFYGSSGGFFWTMPLHYRRPPKTVGGEDTPEGVYMSTATSTYISANGGDTWVKLTTGGLNSATFTGNVLWDRPPMNIRL